MRIHFTASVRYALDQIKSSAESSMVFFLPPLRVATVANYQAQTIDLIRCFSISLSEIMVFMIKIRRTLLCTLDTFINIY